MEEEEEEWGEDVREVHVEIYGGSFFLRGLRVS